MPKATDNKERTDKRTDQRLTDKRNEQIQTYKQSEHKPTDIMTKLTQT